MAGRRAGGESTVGGAINKPQRPSVGELYIQHIATTDLPWRNFVSPEFVTKSQREVPIFLELLNFLITQCRIGGKKPPCQKIISIH